MANMDIISMAPIILICLIFQLNDVSMAITSCDNSIHYGFNE